MIRRNSSHTNTTLSSYTKSLFLVIVIFSISFTILVQFNTLNEISTTHHFFNKDSLMGNDDDALVVMEINENDYENNNENENDEGNHLYDENNDGNVYVNDDSSRNIHSIEGKNGSSEGDSSDREGGGDDDDDTIINDTTISLPTSISIPNKNNINNSNNSNNNNQQQVQQQQSKQFNPYWSDTKCRKQIEDEHYELYNTWLYDKMPLLHYATVIDDTLFVILITMHLQELQGVYERRSDWFCGSSNSSTSVTKNGNPAKEVLRSKRSGFMVVKCHYPPSDTTNVVDDADEIDTIYTSTPSNRTGQITYYNISTMIQCDRTEEEIHTLQKSILSKTEKMTSTTSKTRTISSTKPKYGACTMIQGNKSRHQLHQWVEYHKLIGIEHFWVFLNEPYEDFTSDYDVNESHLPPQDLPYITYLPYNYDIRPHYNYTSYRHGYIFIQVPMQMQCLYMMKKYGFDWVTTTDVDEYIFVTKDVDYNQTSTTIQSLSSSSVELLELPNLINSIPNHEEIGGLELNSIPFGRNVPLEPKTTPHPLLIDYIWRDKEDPWDQPFRHFKCIYNVHTVEDLGVHFMYKGGKTYRLDVKNQARMNHYRNADDGVYIVDRKYDRLKNDTLLVDLYRERLMNAIELSRSTKLYGSINF